MRLGSLAIIILFLANFFSEFAFPIYYKNSYQGYAIWISIVMSFVLAKLVLKKTNFSLAILTLFLLLSSIMSAYQIGDLGVAMSRTLYEQCFKTYAFIALAAVAVYFIPIYKFKTAFKVGHWINLLLIAIAQAFGIWNAIGISSNGSVSAASLVFTLPIFYQDKRWWWPTVLATTVVIVMSRSTTALSMLVAVIVLFILGKLTTKRTALAVLLSFAIVAIFCYLHPGKFLALSGRGHIWWLTKFLADQWGIFGSGIGTYYHDFSHRDWALSSGRYENPFIVHPWAHNDYLQMYYEGGIIGLILYLLAIVSVVFTAIRYKCKMALLGIASYMLYSFGLFPTHIGIDLVILWYYVASVFRKRGWYDKIYYMPWGVPSDITHNPYLKYHRKCRTFDVFNWD